MGSDLVIDVDEHRLTVQAIPFPCIILSHDYGDHEGKAIIDKRIELEQIRDALNRALGE